MNGKSGCMVRLWSGPRSFDSGSTVEFIEITGHQNGQWELTRFSGTNEGFRELSLRPWPLRYCQRSRDSGETLSIANYWTKGDHRPKLHRITRCYNGSLGSP